MAYCINLLCCTVHIHICSVTSGIKQLLLGTYQPGNFWDNIVLYLTKWMISAFQRWKLGMIFSIHSSLSPVFYLLSIIIKVSRKQPNYCNNYLSQFMYGYYFMILCSCDSSVENQKLWANTETFDWIKPYLR